MCVRRDCFIYISSSCVIQNVGVIRFVVLLLFFFHFKKMMCCIVIFFFYT